jgi:hypothetical protein
MYPVLAEGILGDNFLVYLVLAMGGALLVGNIAALVKPPEQRQGDDDFEKAPLLRTVVMGGIGLVATVWALASLFS